MASSVRSITSGKIVRAIDMQFDHPGALGGGMARIDRTHAEIESGPGVMMAEVPGDVDVRGRGRRLRDE